MLNHLQKYENFEAFYQSDIQTLSYATQIDISENQVILNQIKKSAFPLPLDIIATIGALHQLKLLEEDGEYWYIVSTRIKGTPLFAEDNAYLQPSQPLLTEHLIQFLELAKDYEALAPSYQFLLLKETQFILQDNRLCSQELLNLSELPDTPIDFSIIRAQVLQLVSHFLTRLLHTEPTLYSNKNWVPIYDASENMHTITELAMLWLNEINENKSKLQPLPLNNLYVVEPEAAITPAAIRRQKENEKQAALELESLRNDSKQPQKGLRPAVILTLALACILAAIFVIPGILSSFKENNLVKTPDTTTSQNQSTNDTSKDNKPADSTPAPGTSVDSVNSEEKLPVNQISFSSGTWSYDTTQFHGGDRSLKLILSAESPSGKFVLDDISLSKNTNLTLWMMSDTAGYATLKILFYNGDKLIHTFEDKTIFETGQNWYMFNPLTSNTTFDLSKATHMEVEVSGSPQTIWLDDISLESYK